MKKSRTFRKSFVAAIAALCLAAPLTVMPVQVETSYADGAETTTTIYKAYQIFKGTYANGILSDIDWGADINYSDELLTALKQLSVENETPFTNVTNAESVAKALGSEDNNDIVKAFAKFIEGYINGEGDAVTAGTASDVTNGNGYYLVRTETVSTSDAKTRFILQVVDSKITINPKKSVPTIVKKVQENTDVVDYDTYYVDYNDIADYDIGVDIPIVDIGTLPNTLDDYEKYFYEIVDTSDATLAPQIGTEDEKVTGVTVKIDGVEVTQQATIKAEKDSDGNTIITVTFEDIKSVALDDNKEVSASSKVTVEYNAKLTEKADTGINGQESEVYLNFSNNPNENYNPNTSDATEDRPGGIGQTLPDQVIVFTYQIDITKYLDKIKEGNEAGNNDSQKAGFKLLKTIPATDSSGEDTVMVANFNGVKFSGWVQANYEDGKITNGTEVETTSDGVVQFIGIDEGEYTIIETKTPAGYNTMEAKDITIVANTNDSTVTGVNEGDARQNWETDAAAALIALSCDGSNGISEDRGTVKFDILNKAGSTLPSTGGIGTTIFYLGGGTMAAVAGVYLITKKRMKNEEDDEI